VERQLIEAFTSLGRSIVAAIPKISIGLVLVVVGLLVAKAAQAGVRTMLIRLRFDDLMRKTGISSVLKRIGLNQHLSVFLPRLTYLLVLILLAKTVSDALRLTTISNTLGAFFAYLPNIVAALLLLILGTTAGQLAGRMVRQAAESSGIDSARTLGKLTSLLIVFIVAMMAVSQLKIDTEMVRIVTSFVLGAGALAFGLAFGLGTRNIVRDIVAGFYTRKFLTIGTSVEIAGQHGVLASITATHAILLGEGEEISVANSTFLEHITKTTSKA
jgi:small-conductance mechanosensitive channel